MSERPHVFEPALWESTEPLAPEAPSPEAGEARAYGPPWFSIGAVALVLLVLIGGAVWGLSSLLRETPEPVRTTPDAVAVLERNAEADTTAAWGHAEARAALRVDSLVSAMEAPIREATRARLAAEASLAASLEVLRRYQGRPPEAASQTSEDFNAALSIYSRSLE